MADVPNPGSDEAVARGCRCPILDNHHGHSPWDNDTFWISADCPLHGRQGEPVETWAANVVARRGDDD